MFPKKFIRITDHTSKENMPFKHTVIVCVTKKKRKRKEEKIRKRKRRKMFKRTSKTLCSQKSVMPVKLLLNEG